MARKATKPKKNKRKNISKIPPGLIVGGVFFLIILIIIFSIVNLKFNRLKSEVVQLNNYQNEISSAENIIKIVLFDYELDKEHLKKYSKNNITTFEISIPEDKIYSIKQSLISRLSNKGYAHRDSLSFYKDNNFIFDIIISPFEEMKNKEDKNPINVENLINKEIKHKIALILDDAGNSLELAEEVLSLPYPVTLSVIPFTRYDRETSELVRKNNKELFLHLPMEPKSYPETDPGKGAILLNTPESLIEIIIKKDVERLGKIDGVNNHMGSALTESRTKMQQVLKYLKIYTDTFVDSHTSKNTVAYDICKKYLPNCGINNVFIDNSDDPEYIKNKINKGINLLEKNKNVIMIGHLRPNTVKVLKSYLPELEKRGIKFSTVREVLNN